MSLCCKKINPRTERPRAGVRFLGRVYAASPLPTRGLEDHCKFPAGSGLGPPNVILHFIDSRMMAFSGISKASHVALHI